ncbi:MAG: hypothetical protein ACKO4Q_09915 [Planctomycetota bacterium]
MSVAGTPGSGGVTRGRGDADLAFSGETNGRTDEFESQALPEASALDPDSTGLVGVGAATPEAAPRGSGAGLVEGEVSTGRGAWKRRLAPAHRDAVRDFFGQDEPKR